MSETISIPVAYEALSRIRVKTDSLYIRLQTEKKHILGEIEGITSIKYDVLLEALTASLGTLNPDDVVRKLEAWDFGATPRAALIHNRRKPDEVLRARLHEAVASSKEEVANLDAEYVALHPLAEKATQVITLKKALEQYRTESGIFTHPPLTSENYRKPSATRFMFSSSYRKIVGILKDYSAKHGDLLDKVRGAERMLEKETTLKTKLKDVQGKYLRAKQAADSFEANIHVPDTDDVFVNNQIKFTTLRLVEEDEFPADKAALMIQDDSRFEQVVEKFSKLQAQRRVCQQQLQSFRPLFDAVELWQEKIAPACNKLERHKNNRKATIQLDFESIQTGIKSLEDNVTQAIVDMRNQRASAAKIMSVPREKVVHSIQQKTQPSTSNSFAGERAGADRSSSSTTSYDDNSSNFWLYYWLFFDNGNARASEITPLDNVDLTSTLRTLTDQTAALDIQDIQVDTLSATSGTRTLDKALDALDFSVTSDVGSGAADASPSSCGSSCSSGCGGGGGGCGGD